MDKEFYGKEDFKSPNAFREKYNEIFWTNLACVFFFPVTIASIILMIVVSIGFIGLLIFGGVFFFLGWCWNIGLVYSSDIIKATRNKESFREAMEHLRSLETAQCSIHFHTEAFHMVRRTTHSKQGTRVIMHKEVKWTHEETFQIPFSIGRSKEFYDLREYGLKALGIESSPKFFFSKEIEEYVTQRKKSLFSEGKSKDLSCKVTETFIVEGLTSQMVSVDEENLGFWTNLMMSSRTGWVLTLLGGSWFFHIFYNSITTNVHHDVVKYCSFHPFELNASTLCDFKLAIMNQDPNKAPQPFVIPITSLNKVNVHLDQPEDLDKKNTDQRERLISQNRHLDEENNEQHCYFVMQQDDAGKHYKVSPVGENQGNGIPQANPDP